jgi:hypothetical protein
LQEGNRGSASSRAPVLALGKVLVHLEDGRGESSALGQA